MHATIGHKTNFADGTIRCNKRRYRVRSTMQCGQSYLWIRNGILRAPQTRTAPPNSWLGMAHRTAISVERRAQAGACFPRHRSTNRIDFLKPSQPQLEQLLLVRVKCGVRSACTATGSRTRVGLSKTMNCQKCKRSDSHDVH